MKIAERVCAFAHRVRPIMIQPRPDQADRPYHKLATRDRHGRVVYQREWRLGEPRYPCRVADGPAVAQIKQVRYFGHAHCRRFPDANCATWKGWSTGGHEIANLSPSHVGISRERKRRLQSAELEDLNAGPSPWRRPSKILRVGVWSWRLSNCRTGTKGIVRGHLL
jgi:hypothetical protein